MGGMATKKKVCSCPTCAAQGAPQPLSAFGKNLSSPDGLHWYCRECHNAKQRAWKAENVAKVRKWKRQYDRNQRKARNAVPHQLELDLG